MLDTNWGFLTSWRSKLYGYSGQKVTNSYKSSQKSGPFQPKGSITDELPAHPAPVAGHSNSNSLRDGQTQAYSSWELDSYLDTEDRRISMVRRDNSEHHMEDGIAGRDASMGTWDGGSRV